MLACAAIATVANLHGQSPIASPTVTTVKKGVYTAAQAERGKTVYDSACAQCHLPDLSGVPDPDEDLGDPPPLAGKRFLSEWDGATVAALFSNVQTTMPYDAPGALTAQEYADVIAYMLSVNKFPPGDRELAHDPALLQQIRITKNR